MPMKKEVMNRIASEYGCTVQYGNNTTHIQALIGPGGYGSGEYWAVGSVAVASISHSKELVSRTTIEAACKKVLEEEASLPKQVKIITGMMEPLFAKARMEQEALREWSDTANPRWVHHVTDIIRQNLMKRDTLLQKIAALEKVRAEFKAKTGRDLPRMLPTVPSGVVEDISENS